MPPRPPSGDRPPGDDPPVSDVHVIIAGGGTAGHLLPGLAVAAELVERGHPPESIHVVGSDRGVEAELVPPLGHGLHQLPGRGVPRRISADAVRAVVGILRGVAMAFGIVRRLRPRVVIAVGGHAALPCALAAVIHRVPLVLLEQNKRAGAANRLVRWFAAASAVSFEGTDLPRARVTGNPLRPELRDAARNPDRAAARRALGVDDDRVLVAVFSGSLGSRRINEAVFALAERWRDRSDVAIHHVIGRRDWAAVQDRLPAPTGLQYRAVEYEHRVELMLAAADVAVTRAGGTVFELAAFEVPSILVPLPIATRDHQTANAEAMAATGGAVRVPDDELDVDRLVAELSPLVDDPERRHRMAAAIGSAARLDAAAAVAELVEEQLA